MPEDAAIGLADSLNSGEQKIVKEWILGLEAAPQKLAAERTFIAPQQLADWMLSDLQQLHRADRPFVRYFSLDNLYNSNDSETDLALYRKGFAKLINSLSKGSRVIDPVSVGPIDGLLLRVNLNDLAWTERHWTTLINAYSYGIEHFDQPSMNSVVAQTQTPVPLVRADWFCLSRRTGHRCTTICWICRKPYRSWNVNSALM